MNLFRETGSFVAWLGGLSRQFLRHRPLTTLSLIAVSLINRVTAILAFVLPLKVIAVVASHGHSGSMEHFLGAGQNTLVALLVGASVLALVVSIVANSGVRKLSAAGGGAVLDSAAELAVVKDNFATAQLVYAQYGALIAGVIFVLVGMLVIGCVEPSLIVAMVGALVLEFSFTAAVLRRSDPLSTGRLARWISTNTKDYLDILASINFLIALGVLIYPFVWGEGADVFNALLSFIVLRRILRAAVASVRDSVRLSGRRAMIDALFVPGQNYLENHTQSTQTLRELFSKTRREQQAAEQLQAAGVDCDPVAVVWQDSRIAGMQPLAIETRQGDQPGPCYQQQIYWPRQAYRLANETVLFEHMDRESLAAPPLVARFQAASFSCQICRMPRDQPAEPSSEKTDKRRSWPAVHRSLIERLSCVAPPQSLVETYVKSHPLLADRLSDAFVSRIGIAVDTPAEQQCFDALMAALASLRTQLGRLPLYVYNPELRQDNVGGMYTAHPTIMTWGKWSLEPLGFGTPPGLTGDKLARLIAGVRQARDDVPADYGWAGFDLGRQAGQLETHIRNNQLKQSLQDAADLFQNDLIASPAQATDDDGLPIE